MDFNPFQKENKRNPLLRPHLSKGHLSFYNLAPWETAAEIAAAK